MTADSPAPASFMGIVLTLLWLAALALTLSAVACDDKTQTPIHRPVCDGAPISLLNADPCGKSMTIKVLDSASVCNITCAVNRPSNADYTCPVQDLGCIGGTVIADAGAQWGFRFDSTTVVVAEVTAEGMQTTICQINANPDTYNGSLWYIPAAISNITPL